MKYNLFAFAALISISAAVPASAANVIQSGNPQVQQFTQCFVNGTVNLNTQGRVIARGGWNLGPAGFNANGNPIWNNAYQGSVRMATRSQRSLPYSYLDPSTGPEACPTFTPGAGEQ